MIKVVIYSPYGAETEELRSVFAVYSIQNVWADIDVRSASRLEEWMDMAKCADILICDVSREAAISGLKELKRINPAAAILPIADMKVPPIRYVCPEIMPMALLWRPLAKKNVADSITQVMAGFQGQRAAGTDLFEVRNRKTRRYIPYADILYFEAREKKLYLRTEFREIPFRGTLGELTESLPEDFLRCHKSFLVNRRQITAFDRTAQTIELAGKVYIPLSRNYKKSFMEAFDGKT
ncbi:MAG: LytTR family transcriptional regulator [Clostridiales bacterium]|nr:LytTR family transcriptional regulator [Clostridiales bacterium]